MTGTCVQAKDLSKKFLVFKSKATTFQAIKAYLKQESLKREYWVLNKLTFEVRQGEKLALVGKNGAGKTTLLRIIAGIYDKTSGSLEVCEQPNVLFNCWVGFNGDLSVVDNIYLYGAILGIDRGRLEGNVEAILKLNGLSPFQFDPIKELSWGQRQALALSVFFQSTSRFLIVDEGLRFIDQSFKHQCDLFFQKLKESDRTVMIASHDHSFLRKTCRSAIWLEDGCIRAAGKVDEVLDRYEQS